MGHIENTYNLPFLPSDWDREPDSRIRDGNARAWAVAVYYLGQLEKCRPPAATHMLDGSRKPWRAIYRASAQEARGEHDS